MTIVILAVCIILVVLLCLTDYDEFLAIPGVAAIIDIIVILVLIGTVVNGRVIDEKIDMYTQENTVIETAIDELVTEYMDFESSTFKELKNESAITLVSLYPELKSDELVQAQIDTYLANNEKIKELKESKIEITVAKWWLYFGK